MPGELMLVPERWTTSRRFDLRRKDEVVARINLQMVREGGELSVGGTSYTLQRKQMLSGHFELRRDGDVIVSADKPSAMRTRFTINWQNRDFELVRASGFTSGFELRESHRVVGAVRPVHLFTRRSVVDVPPDMDPPIVVFWVALVVLMWNRDAAAAAGT